MFFRKIIDFCNDKAYQNLVKPLIQSKAPVRQVALGVAMGVFVGLTPTVGVQMVIVWALWVFCKYFLKLRFDVIAGTAFVWISNPLTMFFFYYGFLVTGYGFFSFLGVEGKELNYQTFHYRLSSIVNNPDSNVLEIFVENSKFFILDLGYPMILGSLFYAIPFSVVSYILCGKYLRLYRVGKARKMGLDYAAWKEKFERG